MEETLEVLLNEEKRGYAPLNPLVTLYTDTEDGRDPDTFDVAFNKMKKAIEELIERIEQEAQTPIQRFTIGKSFAMTRENRRFDSNNFRTWRKDGISRRWGTTYKNKGYNGLVVLVGITRELLPSDRPDLLDQEQYALELEEDLITHFRSVDPRLGNRSSNPGRLGQDPHAGVLYLAFKLSSIDYRSVPTEALDDFIPPNEEPEGTDSTPNPEPRRQGRQVPAKPTSQLTQKQSDKTTDGNQVSAEDSQEPIASSSTDDPHLDTVQTMASDMSNLTLEESAVETEEEANLDD